MEYLCLQLYIKIGSVEELSFCLIRLKSVKVNFWYQILMIEIDEHSYLRYLRYYNNCPYTICLPESLFFQNNVSKHCFILCSVFCLIFLIFYVFAKNVFMTVLWKCNLFDIFLEKQDDCIFILILYTLTFTDDIQVRFTAVNSFGQ